MANIPSIPLIVPAIHDCHWLQAGACMSESITGFLMKSGDSSPRFAVGNAVCLKEAQVDAQCKLRVLIEVLDPWAG